MPHNANQDLPLANLTLLCEDCDKSFLFSAGEQQYFLSKGLSMPKRCPKCRLARRLGLKAGQIK